VACAEYVGPVRQAILQWKDHGDYEVGTVLAAHLAEVAQAAMTRSGYAGLRDGAGALGELAVVPVPSSAASRMKRGRLQTMELARCVARQLRACGVPARVVEGLAMPRLQAKSVQSGGVRGRARRARSGLRVRLRAFPSRCSGVILVDDICTTGSTILGCARSLHSADIPVVAAFALATVTG
jgi:predicted amidophosphoribosyltransferase